MDSKRIKWTTLAFMAFSTVWGFGNVLNGFVYFNGIQVIFSWIHSTTGPKLAYYAGWTYWACHITYIASKSSGGLKALSWAAIWPWTSA